MEKAVDLASHCETLVVDRRQIRCDGVDVVEITVRRGGEPEECYGLYPDCGFESILALHRFKPPWTGPWIGSKLSELPNETLFALAKLPEEKGGGYLVLSPIADLDAGTVSALRWSERGLDNFDLLVEQDLRGHRSRSDATLLVCVQVPAGVSAARAAKIAAARVAEALRGVERRPCQLREEKPLPEVLRSWGWCSWDAYGVGVAAKDLLAVAAKAKPAWMVLDDGWQEEVSADKWREWLHTPQSGQLGRKGLDVADLASKLKPAELFVWHTLHGYWGGVAAGRGYATGRSRPRWPDGLRMQCPGELDVWDGDFSLVEPKDVERFYKEFYQGLHAAGVQGVKCDGQFLPEVLLGPFGACAYRAAQEEAALAVFGEVPPALHCMGMTLPAIHGCGRASVTRVSDDHAYPNVEEDAKTVARHIWHCAVNSVWLSGFVHCDWDMFRTGAWHAGMHAAARAVSGGPVYVSDKAEVLDPEALKPLLLPDGKGRVVPCSGAGAPVDRHVFVNPTATNTAYLVSNATAAGWIVVAFGLCDTGGALMGATLLPSDFGTKEDLVCLQLESPEEYHCAPLSGTGWDVSLHFMNFKCLAVAPILAVGRGRVVVFGLKGVWNPTGTLEKAPRALESGVEVHTRCAGELLVWLDMVCGRPEQSQACMLRVDGGGAVKVEEVGLTSLTVPAGVFTLKLEYV